MRCATGSINGIVHRNCWKVVFLVVVACIVTSDFIFQNSERNNAGSAFRNRICPLVPVVDAFGVSHSRFFVKGGGGGGQNIEKPKPKLILIGGPPGTGKSTFGMSVALDQGILKCISTDTVRAVMRSFVSHDISPALHRSSYSEAFEGDDPVRSWKETCAVLGTSVETLIDDAIDRGTSIVVEGVHVVPSTKLIERWQEKGGIAIGCILQISDEEKHRKQFRKRGTMTGVMEAEEDKLASFQRIRRIQDELIKLAKENNWLQIEQRTAPDPLDLVGSALDGSTAFASNKIYEVMEEEEDLYTEMMDEEGTEVNEHQKHEVHISHKENGLNVNGRK